MSESNGYATKEKARFARIYKDLTAPNGDKYRIQSFSFGETEELQFAMIGRDGKPNLEAACIGHQAMVIVKGWVDGGNQRVLGDDDGSFVQDEMDPDIAEWLADEITSHSGLNESRIERLKKRFSDGQPSNSHTNSPKPSEHST